MSCVAEQLSKLSKIKEMLERTFDGANDKIILTYLLTYLLTY